MLFFPHSDTTRLVISTEHIQTTVTILFVSNCFTVCGRSVATSGAKSQASYSIRHRRHCCCVQSQLLSSACGNQLAVTLLVELCMTRACVFMPNKIKQLNGRTQQSEVVPMTQLNSTK